MDKKKFMHIKSIDEASKSVVGYVSDYNWDRDGERFIKGAWDLGNFLKNPVVLLRHNHFSHFPVAKAADISEDENGLLAKTVFHDETEEARIAFNLYKGGFLNAFSVGFRPKEFRRDLMPDGKSMGITFTKSELLEYSVAPIPVNPGAVVSKEVGEMVTKVFGDGLLKKVGDDGFLVLPEIAPVRPGEPDDVVAALKQIKDLARIVKGMKGKPMDESRLSLLKGTMDVLNEALVEGGGILPQDMDRLSVALKEWADVVKGYMPARAEAISQAISQVGKALTGPQG